MTRGNQRDSAREKNLKKQSEQRKSKASSQKDGNKGLTLEERRLRTVSGNHKLTESSKHIHEDCEKHHMLKAFTVDEHKVSEEECGTFKDKLKELFTFTP
ncbi:hypothetical protein Smp_019420 [Schistosoma mansoni]|uniref:hypothetical protein n=1 Tax=Schistosoma mansoni TaxID=6183 RepID=UPI0001A642E4|nr:hypothetical protein Smp_019420 [Schistosoma mansoni]|eukprot:XP_018644871.1 hypothetical protein Smp_019420 [Schistosoma mansoni]